MVAGTDLMVVRELAGGLYFGEPRSLEPDRGVNTLVYTTAEVERIAKVAFDLARVRRRKVTRRSTRPTSWRPASSGGAP